MSNQNLRNALFSAQMRNESVTLACGVEVRIRQVSQAEGDRLMRIMRDESAPLGYRNACMINSRCTNPDGSAIFDEQDLRTFEKNVAADSPILLELVSLITAFDKQTQDMYVEAQKK